MKNAVIHCLIFSGVLFSTCSVANPVLNNVANGNVSIQQTAATTTVNQASHNAIINWHSFNIGAGEKTAFIQPKNGIALNRIDPSQGVSQIFGSLTATGKIILINQSGVFFGPGSYVNVGGIIVSTTDMSDKNFLAHKFIFDQPSPYQGSIINNGTIVAREHGLVGLLGPSVVNNGVISARLGNVVLASGSEFTLDLYGDQLINFQINKGTTAPGKDQNGNVLTDGVKNTGAIYAAGGRVLLTGAAAEGVLDHVINTTGIVEANSVAQHNGEIIFSGGDQGVVRVAGRVSATGMAKGQRGGTVEIAGHDILLDNGTNVDVSGDVAGGKILIGGDVHGQSISVLNNQVLPNAAATVILPQVNLTANSLSGLGGEIIAWSDGVTKVYGTLSATGATGGGFVETSGHYLDVQGISVNLRAQNGNTGTWLLDPTDLTIDTTPTQNVTASGTPTDLFAADGNSTTSTLLNTDLEDALANADVVVQTTIGGTGTGSGDITVAAPLAWTSGFGLTLSAAGSITINNTIDGNGFLTLTAGNQVAINSDIGDTTQPTILTVTGSNGIALNNISIHTTSDQLYNQAVTLGGGTSTTINLTSDNGNITFQSTVDGAISGDNSLYIDAFGNNSSVNFNGDVGDTVPLNNLDVDDSNTINATSITTTNGMYLQGALDFTGSINTSNGTIEIDPQGRQSNFSINSGQDSNDVSINATNVSNGAIQFDDPFFLGGKLTLTAGSTINLSNIDDDGSGSSQLFIAPASSSPNLIVYLQTLGGNAPLKVISMNANSIVTNNNPISIATIDNQTYSPITVSSGDSLTLTSENGDISLDGVSGTGTSSPGLSITSPQLTLLDNISLDNTVSISTDSLTSSNVTISTTNGGLIALSSDNTSDILLTGELTLSSTNGNISLNSAIDDGGAHTSALTLSTGGNVILGDTIGASSPIASFSVTGSRVGFSGTPSVTTIGDQNYTNTSPLSFNAATNTLTSNTGSITLSDAIQFGASLILNAPQGEVFLNAFTLTGSGSPSLTIYAKGDINYLSVIENSSLDPIAPLTSTTLIFHTVDDQDFPGTVSPTAGQTTFISDGNITFEDKLNGNNITVTASNGTATFDNDINYTSNLNITANEITFFEPSHQTLNITGTFFVGAAQLIGTINLDTNLSIIADGGLTFGSDPILSPNASSLILSVELSGSPGTVLPSVIGTALQPLGGFDDEVNSTTTFSGNLYSNGEININSALTTNNASFNTTNGAEILLNTPTTVNGTLTLTSDTGLISITQSLTDGGSNNSSVIIAPSSGSVAGPSVIFQNAPSVTSLSISSTQTTTFLNGVSNVTTTGDQTYNAPVIVDNNTMTFQGNNISFNDGLSSPGNSVNTSATGNVSFTDSLANPVSVDTLVNQSNTLTLISSGDNVTWNISGTQSGSVTGFGVITTSFTYTNTPNLVGEDASDTFSFAPGGTTGSIQGGSNTQSVIDISQFSSEDDITLSGAGTNQGIAGSDTGGIIGTFNNITNLLGTTAGNNNLIGSSSSNNFSISGTDSGSVTVGSKTMTFSNFQNIQGGSGANTFTLSGGSITGTLTGGSGNNTLVGTNGTTSWSLTSLNSGTVAGIGGGFSGIQNLTGGTGNNTFILADGAGVSGTINGGGTNATNTIDVSAYSAPVAVVLSSTNSGLINNNSGVTFANFSNINNSIGTGTSSIKLPNSSNTVNVSGSNQGGINDPFNFSQYNTIISQSGHDTLSFSASSFSYDPSTGIAIINGVPMFFINFGSPTPTPTPTPTPSSPTFSTDQLTSANSTVISNGSGTQEILNNSSSNTMLLSPNALTVDATISDLLQYQVSLDYNAQNSLTVNLTCGG